ncbi:MAG TPA: hypothetical protein PLT65_00830 [Bacilli bacterium]|nr:hypothetical protein [Bacilli bacterium]
MVKLLLERIGKRESIVLSKLILFLSTYEQETLFFGLKRNLV